MPHSGQANTMKDGKHCRNRLSRYPPHCLDLRLSNQTRIKAFLPESISPGSPGAPRKKQGPGSLPPFFFLHGDPQNAGTILLSHSNTCAFLQKLNPDNKIPYTTGIFRHIIFLGTFSKEGDFLKSEIICRNSLHLKGVGAPLPSPIAATTPSKSLHKTQILMDRKLIDKDVRPRRPAMTFPYKGGVRHTEKIQDSNFRQSLAMEFASEHCLGGMSAKTGKTRLDRVGMGQGDTDLAGCEPGHFVPDYAFCRLAGKPCRARPPCSCARRADFVSEDSCSRTSMGISGKKIPNSAIEGAPSKKAI